MNGLIIIIIITSITIIIIIIMLRMIIKECKGGAHMGGQRGSASLGLTHQLMSAPDTLVIIIVILIIIVIVLYCHDWYIHDDHQLTCVFYGLIIDQ